MPAFVLFGYNQANLGSLLNLEDWVKYFPRIDTIHTKGAQNANNATIKGLVNAMLTVGALPACLTCSYTADRFGRKPVIFAGAFLTLIGEVLQASAFALPQLIIGRLILGAGVGVLSGTVPTWQSECSAAQHRGKHVVTMGMFIALGYVLQAWIELGFYQFKTGPVTWRPPVAIPIAFSLMLMGTVWIMPESPRWLILKGRRSEAQAVVGALKDIPEDGDAVDAEVFAIETSLEKTKTSATSLFSLLKMGQDKMLYRFGICVLLQFFQQVRFPPPIMYLFVF